MSIEDNSKKKALLARRVLAPQKEALACRVQQSINKGKKIELASRLLSLTGKKVTLEEESSCGCNVHFSVDPRLTDFGGRSSLTAHEANPDYNWNSLMAAGVNPASLVSAESQVYQLVNQGSLRASAALGLLGLEA